LTGPFSAPPGRPFETPAGRLLAHPLDLDVIRGG
jgi:hypothetical protein